MLNREKLRRGGNGAITARPASSRWYSRPMNFIALVFGSVLVYSLLTSFSFVYHSQDTVSAVQKDALFVESMLRAAEKGQRIAPSNFDRRTAPVMAAPDETEEGSTDQDEEDPDETERDETEEDATEDDETEEDETEEDETEEDETEEWSASDKLPDGSNTFSACLMVMDDNHRLVEWIAYHYFVMNLRYLVILPDRFSRYWPDSILDKWRRYMTIEQWTEEDFMDEKHAERAHNFIQRRNKTSTSSAARQQYHMERQSFYYQHCALHMQAMNRTWVSFHDVDEYYVINSELVNNAAERMGEPGSVLKVLNQVQSIVKPLFNLTNISLTEHHMTPCVTTYRLRYGAVESTEEELRQGVPDFIDPRRFETLRWRHYAKKTKVLPQVGKSLLDVSKIPDLENKHYKDRPLTPFSPHRILPMCANPYVHKNTFIRVLHYIGSWEYYSFRTNDGRKGASKNRGRWEQYSAQEGGKAGDEARPWIDGFVRLFGEEESKHLLVGSGLDSNYTATIDPSWVKTTKKKNTTETNTTKKKKRKKLFNTTVTNTTKKKKKKKKKKKTKHTMPLPG